MRALGRLPQLNVPEPFIKRHPFPGDLSSSSHAMTSTDKHHRRLIAECTAACAPHLTSAFLITHWEEDCCSCNLAAAVQSNKALCLIHKSHAVDNELANAWGFAGPGLAVRVLGDVTEGNALEVLRQVGPSASHQSSY